MLEEESKGKRSFNVDVNIIKKINSLDEFVSGINKVQSNKLSEYSIGVFEVTNGGGSNRNLKWKIDEALRGEQVVDYLVKKNNDFSKLNHYYAIVFVLRDFNEIQNSLLNFGFAVVPTNYTGNYNSVMDSERAYNDVYGDTYQLRKFLGKDNLGRKKSRNERKFIKEYNVKLNRLDDVLFLPYYRSNLLVKCLTEPRKKYNETERLWLKLLNLTLLKGDTKESLEPGEERIIRTFIHDNLVYLLRNYPDPNNDNPLNINLELVTIKELIELLFGNKRVLKEEYKLIKDNLLSKLKNRNIKSFDFKRESHVAIMSNLIFASLSGIKGKIAEEYFERLLLSKLIESPEYNGKDNANNTNNSKVLLYIPNLPHNLNYHLRGEIDLIVFAKKEALSRAINDIKKEYNPFLF